MTALAIANTATASADNSGATKCPAAYQLVSVAYMESVGPYIDPNRPEQGRWNNHLVHQHP
jgi:hypothetical protein